MQSDIQIMHLRTLIAIAEEGGFGAASQRVGRTQSAVTLQMQALEDVVGVPLFLSKGRRRELTEAGKTLLRYGYEITSMSNHALSATARSNRTGIVRIGAPQEIAEDLLPAALSEFEKTWPDTRIIVEVDRSPLLMQRLEQGLLDIALSTRRSDGYKSDLLGHLPVEWIAHRDWTPEQGAPLPLVLSDEPSMFRRIALAALDLSAQPYVERLTSPSLAGIRLAVFAGMGVTARTPSSWFSETNYLSEKDGLPKLPSVPYYIHKPIEVEGPLIRELSEIIRSKSETHFQK